MKKLGAGTWFLVVPFVMMTFGAAISAQGPGKIPLSAQRMTDTQPPKPKGSNPKPEEAVKAILTAFDEYQVVGMNAAHGNKDLDDFILDLIRNPAFPDKVNDIVVECGNSLYQPVLDRYIAGDDVPLAEARQAWRNTTQPMCGLSGFYEELFPLVRRINQKLPAKKKLRVLAGDPPIDWSKVKSPEDFGQYMTRDDSIASVMKKEVLSKQRKALMLFGAAHLYHQGGGSGTEFPSAVQLYEKDYPGVTLVIADHVGFFNWSPRAKYNAEFEARMASWPVPSLVLQMKGTWLADLMDMNQPSGNVFFGKQAGGESSEGGREEVIAGYSQKVDAYLYLGPRDLLLRELKPAEIFLDKDYIAELQRRAGIMGPMGDLMTDETNPEKVLEDDSNTFFYDPDEMRKAIQSAR
jgi:hypothetical protein